MFDRVTAEKAYPIIMEKLTAKLLDFHAWYASVLTSGLYSPEILKLLSIVISAPGRAYAKMSCDNLGELGSDVAGAAESEVRSLYQLVTAPWSFDTSEEITRKFTLGEHIFQERCLTMDTLSKKVSEVSNGGALVGGAIAFEHSQLIYYVMLTLGAGHSNQWPQDAISLLPPDCQGKSFDL